MSVCAVGALRSQVCTITSALTWVFAYSANAFTCGASLLTAQQPFSNLNVLFLFCLFFVFLSSQKIKHFVIV